MPDAIDEAQSRMLASEEALLAQRSSSYPFQVLYRDKNGRAKPLNLKGKSMTASEVGDILYDLGVQPQRGGRYARGYFDQETQRVVICGNDPELEQQLREQLTPAKKSRR